MSVSTVTWEWECDCGFRGDHRGQDGRHVASAKRVEHRKSGCNSTFYIVHMKTTMWEAKALEDEVGP